MRIQPVSVLWLIVIGCALLASCAASSVGPTASGAAPSLSQVAPLTGAVGASVTVRGSGFASTNNTVKFGRGYIRNLDSPDGTPIRFTVPGGLDLCPPDSITLCPGAYPPVTPGDYSIAVMTGGETSNSVTFTVTS
jgi:hypothetical protein